jgi:hypothetical protein
MLLGVPSWAISTLPQEWQVKAEELGRSQALQAANEAATQQQAAAQQQRQQQQAAEQESAPASPAQQQEPAPVYAELESGGWRPLSHRGRSRASRSSELLFSEEPAASLGHLRHRAHQGDLVWGVPLQRDEDRLCALLSQVRRGRRGWEDNMDIWSG